MRCRPGSPVRHTSICSRPSPSLSPLTSCQSLGGGELATVTTVPAPAGAPPMALPNAQDSLKFCVLGDFGTGSRQQYQLAARMAELHKTFPFEMCALVGDNLYGGQRSQDFQKKFEIPYKPLLDANVKFYASLGNHDAREQRFYKLFNMEGKLYYSFKAPKQDVRFFALETTYPVPEQIKWLEEELKKSGEKWKIAYFHHPAVLVCRPPRVGPAVAPDARAAVHRSTGSTSSSPDTITSTNGSSRRTGSPISSPVPADSSARVTAAVRRRSPIASWIPRASSWWRRFPAIGWCSTR